MAGRLTPSGLVLLLVNLVPLAGVIWLDWDVYSILLLYWSENVVIGLLNLVRIAVAPRGVNTSVRDKLFMLPFFTVHYGMFTAGHGIILASLFGDEPSAAAGLIGVFPALFETLASRGLLLSAGALAGSHLFSLLINDILHGEVQRTTARRLMARPYARVAILHIALIGGGILVKALHQPIVLLLILVLMKIAVDLAAHGRAHRAEAR